MSTYNDAVNYLLSVLPTVTVRAVLVDTDVYTYAAGHTMVDIPAGARLATSPAMTGMTVDALGWSVSSYSFDAPAEATNVAIVYYVDNGSDAANRLLAHIAVTPSQAPNGIIDFQVSGHIVLQG